MLAPVTFRYTIRLHCETEPDAALVVALLPARTHHQQLAMEQLRVRGANAQSVFTEAATATRYLHLSARGGPLDVELDARVRLLQTEPGREHVRRETHRQRLGAPESLRYLLPSRWCPSDTLAGLAEREFLQIDPPLERMLAVDRWVRRHMRLIGPGDAPPDPAAGDRVDAFQALEHGAGTPHDLAHLCIALCRAARLPARFVTTVPLEATGARALHPWVEVLVDDVWLALEPTRRVPRTALLRLGTGRDAADVPLVIAHGDIAGLAADMSIAPEGTSLDVLRERDRRAEAICAATLGSLGEATRWHQEARRAARHPGLDVDADPPRPAPSRVAAAAVRAASTTPRGGDQVLVFPRPVLPVPGAPPVSRFEPV